MIWGCTVSSIICNNLRPAYPNAQIDYLAESNSCFRGNPNIDTIISFEEKHRKKKELLI
jgi:heptosyltransferase-2